MLAAEVTVIVATAEPARTGQRSPGRAPDPAVAELRRSLEALSGDEVALSRAMRRPLMIDLGRHPLGNLLLHSLSSGFGDLPSASLWLGSQLGISGRVLPATVEPLTLMEQPAAAGGPSIAERPRVSPGVVDAIREADLVLLAPGALDAGIVLLSAIPEIREALRATPARIVWISNLASQRGETVTEQVDTLTGHGIRIDAVLYDPDAGSPVAAGDLRTRGIVAIARPLADRTGTAHDAQLLSAALAEVSSEVQHRA
jgi:uncharacterized cofD-like protein